MDNKTPFDAGRYLTKVGSADYLEVKWRLVWLRDMYPDAIIETECIKLITPLPDPETGVISGYAAFKATVTIPGKGAATAHGSETFQDFREYMEKAETKAIGRALALLGFGTQFTGPELDSNMVDSPVTRQAQQQPQPNRRESNRPQQQPGVSTQGTTQRTKGTEGAPTQAVAERSGPDESPRPPVVAGPGPYGKATPRQVSLLKTLINQQGENGEDFNDRLITLDASQAHKWIEQLNVGILPWLTIDPDEPKPAAVTMTPEQMVAQVLRLGSPRAEQQTHWDHWVNAAGTDMNKWRNLFVQARQAIKQDPNQAWRLTMMLKRAPTIEVGYGIKEEAEKLVVYSPDMEDAMNRRFAELDEDQS